MNNIKTYYLIDYENVNSNGLVGCDKLTKSDYIIIFFTKNAMRINMSEIANHGTAELEMIEIPAGKQSTDIHIGSYIGYLSGMNDKKSCAIVVVSKDSDFDNVIKFWKTKTGVNISRTHQIKVLNGKKIQTKSSVFQSKKQQLSPKGNTKSTLNQKVMQILSKAAFDNEIIGFVASTVAKNNGIKNSKQQIYRTIISKYGQGKGLSIYNHIKKII